MPLSIRLRPVALVALGLLCARPASPQETVSHASVSGRVRDASGAAVAGAQVTARHAETNVVRSTSTDTEGRFRFPYLSVGPYEISVRQAGFREETRRLTLGVAAALELPIALALQAPDTSLTVSGETPALETARSQIAGTLSQAEVRSLPMNGRQLLDLALLVPGVSPTNIGGTQLFPETSAVPGVGISVASQRNLSNNFIVDGVSANDDAAGLLGVSYGVDAVDQLQVVTSGGQAELGRALGGYVNVVTKSGTNAWRGDAYGYFRDQRWNAPNALSGSKLPMAQQQYGASLGGPLAHDRTFFFTNVERRDLDQSGLVTIGLADVEAVNAKLAALRYPGPPLTTGVYPNPVRTTHALAKLDHHWSKDQLSLRYSLYDVSSLHSRGAGALFAPSASAGLDNTDHSLAFSYILSVSPRTVNETRVQLAHGDLLAPPADPVGPAVSIAGVATFGTLSSSPTGRRNTLLQLVDNLSHQAGAHALRAGVDFLGNRDTITFPRSARGSYSFSSLQSFLAGVYNNAGFTQSFGERVVEQANPNLGVFVQDEWKATKQLTLNLGLRYDLQFLESIETDKDNVSPRVGFAWTPFAARRTLLRGSAGLFYDRVPLRALANALLSAGNTTDLAGLRQIGVSLSPGQAGAPVFPNLLPGVVPSVTLVNFTTMDRRLQNAHSRQAGVELEQQLGERGTLSIAYQYLRGLDLLLSLNQNVPSCVPAGTNNGCRPNPGYANDSRYSAAGHSNYHGLHVSLLQRPVRWGSYRVSYAYSKSMNDVGEAFFNSPIDPFDISKDWGRSDDDQRHRLAVSGALLAPLGLQLSGMLQYYSALPFNITSGVTTLQGTAGRPIVNGSFIERNSGKGSDFFSVNLRVCKAFRRGERLHMDAIAEAFNIFDRRNAIARNANFGAGAYPTNPLPSFGQVTAVGEPRTLQFGVRVGF